MREMSIIIDEMEGNKRERRGGERGGRGERRERGEGEEGRERGRGKGHSLLQSFS